VALLLAAGALVMLLDGSILITGEVDRTTDFEHGMPPAHQHWTGTTWEPDPLILDDQALVANVLGKGLVIVTGCGHAGRPLLEAQAREHAAEALAAAGHGPEARLQLDAAQDHYARLGASWDAARADARLRAHGIRRGVHGERKRPKAGWAALTDTEKTVAALLAEGRSNPDIGARMFISRRTVQFHVSNILAKLGLSSRVELAALVARRAG
jgi:DNA-binding CsgD family transcriptional regulator